MNIKQLILAVTVLTVTGVVFAQVPYPAAKPVFPTKTRAEVATELAQAPAQELMQDKNGNRVKSLYSPH